MKTTPDNSIERDRSLSSTSLQSTTSLTTLMSGPDSCESEGGGLRTDGRTRRFHHLYYFKIRVDPEHWAPSRESSLL